jgi:hypothetical protein
MQVCDLYDLSLPIPFDVGFAADKCNGVIAQPHDRAFDDTSKKGTPLMP